MESHQTENNKRVYWQNVVGDIDSLSKNAKKAFLKFSDTENLTGLNFEKLHTKTIFPIYTIRVNKKIRCIFTIVQKSLILLEELKNHKHDTANILRAPQNQLKIINDLHQKYGKISKEHFLKKLKESIEIEPEEETLESIEDPLLNDLLDENEEIENEKEHSTVILIDGKFILLDSAQSEAVKYMPEYNNPKKALKKGKLVVGTAGSGKTTVGIAFLNEYNRRNPNKKACFIAENPKLLAKAEENCNHSFDCLTYEDFAIHVDPDLKNQLGKKEKKLVYKDTFDHWLNKIYLSRLKKDLNRLLKGNNQIKTPEIEILEKKKTLFSSIKNQLYYELCIFFAYIDTKEDYEHLEELSSEEILKKFGGYFELGSFQSYVSKEDREFIKDLAISYKSYLGKTEIDLSFYPLTIKNRVGSVIVDESQDMATLKKKQLFNATEDHIFLFKDNNQKLGFLFTADHLLIEKEKFDLIKLEKNYRCPKSVIEVANEILKLKQVAMKGILNPKETTVQMEVPKTKEEEKSKEEEKFSPIKLITPTDLENDSVYKTFHTETVIITNDKELKMTSNNIVLNAQECRGLEFCRVYLIEPLSGLIWEKISEALPLFDPNQTLAINLNKPKEITNSIEMQDAWDSLFIMLTRCIESIIIVQSQNTKIANVLNYIKAIIIAKGKFNENREIKADTRESLIHKHNLYVQNGLKEQANKISDMFGEFKKDLENKKENVEDKKENNYQKTKNATNEQNNINSNSPQEISKIAHLLKENQYANIIKMIHRNPNLAKAIDLFKLLSMLISITEDIEKNLPLQKLLVLRNDVIDLFNLCLYFGADLYQENITNETLLQVALQAKCSPVVRFLIQPKDIARISKTSNNEFDNKKFQFNVNHETSPLKLAIDLGCYTSVIDLLEDGADYLKEITVSDKKYRFFDYAKKFKYKAIDMIDEHLAQLEKITKDKSKIIEYCAAISKKEALELEKTNLESEMPFMERFLLGIEIIHFLDSSDDIVADDLYEKYFEHLYTRDKYYEIFYICMFKTPMTSETSYITRLEYFLTKFKNQEKEFNLFLKKMIKDCFQNGSHGPSFFKNNQKQLFSCLAGLEEIKRNPELLLDLEIPLIANNNVDILNSLISSQLLSIKLDKNFFIRVNLFYNKKNFKDFLIMLAKVYEDHIKKIITPPHKNQNKDEKIYNAYCDFIEALIYFNHLYLLQELNKIGLNLTKYPIKHLQELILTSFFYKNYDLILFLSDFVESINLETLKLFIITFFGSRETFIKLLDALTKYKSDNNLLTQAYGSLLNMAIMFNPFCIPILLEKKASLEVAFLLLINPDKYQRIYVSEYLIRRCVESSISEAYLRLMLSKNSNIKNLTGTNEELLTIAKEVKKEKFVDIISNSNKKKCSVTNYDRKKMGEVEARANILMIENLCESLLKSLQITDILNKEINDLKEQRNQNSMTESDYLSKKSINEYHIIVLNDQITFLKKAIFIYHHYDSINFNKLLALAIDNKNYIFFEFILNLQYPLDQSYEGKSHLIRAIEKAEHLIIKAILYDNIPLINEYISTPEDKQMLPYEYFYYLHQKTEDKDLQSMMLKFLEITFLQLLGMENNQVKKDELINKLMKNYGNLLPEIYSNYQKFPLKIFFNELYFYNLQSNNLFIITTLINLGVDINYSQSVKNDNTDLIYSPIIIILGNDLFSINLLNFLLKKGVFLFADQLNIFRFAAKHNILTVFLNAILDHEKSRDQFFNEKNKIKYATTYEFLINFLNENKLKNEIKRLESFGFICTPKDPTNLISQSFLNFNPPQEAVNNSSMETVNVLPNKLQHK